MFDHRLRKRWIFIVFEWNPGSDRRYRTVWHWLREYLFDGINTGVVADGIEFKEGLEVIFFETDFIPEELTLQHDRDWFIGYFVCFRNLF